MNSAYLFLAFALVKAIKVRSVCKTAKREAYTSSYLSVGLKQQARIFRDEHLQQVHRSRRHSGRCMDSS